MQDILEGLDDIDWSSLTHAYGEASDVPSLLRSLLSENEVKRRDAAYQLLGNVWHQGTIYQASAYVVPFLVSLLTKSNIPDRDLVALIFASIADGSSYLEVHAIRDAESEDRWRKILSDEGKDFEAELEKEREWVKTTREAVEPKLDMIFEFLGHEDSEIRLAVASALGNYQSHISKSLPLLRDAHQSEVDDHVREAIVSAIHMLESEHD